MATVGRGRTAWGNRTFGGHPSSAQASLKKNPQTARAQQGIQAPRGQQDIQAPRVNDAAALVRQANAPCKKGDMTNAAQKAREALALLFSKQARARRFSLSMRRTTMPSEKRSGGGW
jgi:hypothetical protein